jgi:uncharacterized protein YdhG (YjbR/CyaY superfamily)
VLRCSNRAWEVNPGAAQRNFSTAQAGTLAGSEGGKKVPACLGRIDRRFLAMADVKVIEIVKKKVSGKRAPVNRVSEYIAKAPKAVQGKLRQIRTAIREAAPGATERTDYFQWPGYSYEGYDYDGMFVWFSYKEPHVRLHVRPPVIQNHKKELAGLFTTKAIVGFPADRPIPKPLVKRLVKASIKVMKDKAK